MAGFHEQQRRIAVSDERGNVRFEHLSLVELHGEAVEEALVVLTYSQPAAGPEVHPGTTGPQAPVGIDEQSVFASQRVVVATDHIPGVFWVQVGEQVLDVAFLIGFAAIADERRVVASGPGGHRRHVENPRVVGRPRAGLVGPDPGDQANRCSVRGIYLVGFDVHAVDLWDRMAFEGCGKDRPHYCFAGLVQAERFRPVQGPSDALPRGRVHEDVIT